MKPSTKWVAGLAAATLTLVGGAAPALAADDTNRATAGSKPGGIPCIDNGSGAIACFQSRGDKVWVKDDKADGHSAINVWSQYLGPGEYREGWCRNTLGAGRWGYCNKEMRESTYIEFWAVEYDAETKRWLDWSVDQTDVT
jgi:hypothetical protein